MLGEKEKLFIEREEGKGEGLIYLPRGDYLTLSCLKKEKEEAIRQLKERAKADYGVIGSPIIAMIEVSGLAKRVFHVQIKVA